MESEKVLRWRVPPDTGRQVESGGKAHDRSLGWTTLISSSFNLLPKNIPHVFHSMSLSVLALDSFPYLTRWWMGFRLVRYLIIFLDGTQDMAADCVRIERMLYFGRDFLCGLDPPVLKLKFIGPSLSEYVSVVDGGNATSAQQRPLRSNDLAAVSFFVFPLLPVSVDCRSIGCRPSPSLRIAHAECCCRLRSGNSAWPLSFFLNSDKM